MLNKDGFAIVRCRACGLVYVDADMQSADLVERYGAEYYGGTVFHDYLGEREERLAGARQQCGLLARLQPSGRLLDVGCATGFFLEAASRTWDVTGVELSEFAADYARREFGHHVITGDISEAGLPDAAFDVITLWNTIEHVSNPLSVMENIARVAAPGALIVLTTGNVAGFQARRDLANWNLMTPPEHLYFFDPKTISLLLERTGLWVRRVAHDGITTESGILASSRARMFASLVTGNVMTVFARNDDRNGRGGTSIPVRLQRALRPIRTV